MSDADEMLRDLFSEDLPPIRDTRFTAAVIMRLERMRLVQDVSWMALAAVAGAAALWALAPLLNDPVLSAARELAPLAATSVLALAILSFAGVGPTLSRDPES